MLVEGVEDQERPEGRASIYFLRRIPRDPLTGEEWGMRSYASPADCAATGNDVFDVYSRSDDDRHERRPYRDGEA